MRRTFLFRLILASYLSTSRRTQRNDHAPPLDRKFPGEVLGNQTARLFGTKLAEEDESCAPVSAPASAPAAESKDEKKEEGKENEKKEEYKRM